MGYDVTNNSSIVELTTNIIIANQGQTKAIKLPESVPSPELVGQESVKPVGEIVVLPNTLPSPELMPVEGVVSQEQIIEIPDVIPPDGVVLLETIGLPPQQTGGSITVSGDKYYVHSQGIAATVWDIRHNLNKRPSIHIEDMSGNEMIPQIIHINNNRAQAIFGRDYSGSAHCN